ncbi:MAG: hypothetical protein ABF975_07935 [Liquorilactobacillus hordei]|uniref:hypothetical protein n=1 Tax=Liquorilactobacillus hordei TaxID=468911 RepID=UPI0039E8D7BA
MILAIGYRVRSACGSHQEIRVNYFERVSNHGVSLDTEKLISDWTYFKNLQKRICDIRSSE